MCNRNYLFVVLPKQCKYGAHNGGKQCKRLYPSPLKTNNNIDQNQLNYRRFADDGNCTNKIHLNGEIE